MLCYLPYPHNVQRSIAVEIDGDVICSIRIVASPETVATLDQQIAKIGTFQAVRSFVEAYFEVGASRQSIECATREILPRLAPAPTPFSALVRQILLTRIPFGERTTFSELACMLGKPRAVCAVGRAVANNPFHIVVPSHRVLVKNFNRIFDAADGDIKRELLMHEDRCSHAPMTAMIPF